MPVEYRRALAEMAKEKAATHAGRGVVWARSPAFSRSSGTTATTRRSRSVSSTGTNSCCRCRRRKSRDQAARCMDCGALPRYWRTPAARSTTRSRTGTTSSIAADWERGRAQPAFDQQFPGVHRPRLPGAVRGVLHAQHRRQSGHHQDDRMRRSSTAPRARAGSSPSRRRTRPASRSPSSAPARRGSPARSSSRAPGMTCTSTRSGQGRRPAALRHSRLQDGEASTSTAASSRCRPRACTFHYGADVGVNVPAEKLRRASTTPWCSPAAPRSRATCRCPAASSRASISPWISCRSRTAA